ncbi:MAG: hypothetical protein V4671_04945 [Armatimonadota bacterium]
MTKRMTVLMLWFLALLAAIAPQSAHAQAMRPATKLAVGETAHFTLSKGESQDYAIQLGTGSYYVMWDLKRVEGTPSNIIAKVELLKTNGVMVNSRLLGVNETSVIARTAEPFKQAKPLAARLRVSTDYGPYEVWLRVIPAAKMAFVPFPFENGDLKPLGIGATQGKGGNLQPYAWAFHSATLPAGKYDVTLYMKRVDGMDSNIIGHLQQLDKNGLIVSGGRINMNETDKEARSDMRLVLTKPTKVLFQLTNDRAPMDYTVGIEKATD